MVIMVIILFWIFLECLIMKNLEGKDFSPLSRFVCGIIAGISACILTQPFDFIKTQMQLYPGKYRSFIQIIEVIYSVSGAYSFILHWWKKPLFSQSYLVDFKISSTCLSKKLLIKQGLLINKKKILFYCLVLIISGWFNSAKC